MYPRASSAYRDLGYTPFSAGTTHRDEANALVAKLRNKGVDVITIVGSDPVYEGFRDKAMEKYVIEAVKDKQYMYAARTPWLNELRSAITEWEKKYRSTNYTPDDIILAPGVAGAVCILNHAMLDPKVPSEVLVPEPGHYIWTMAIFADILKAESIQSPSIEEKDWEIDLEELRKRMTEKTKYIFLESPCNPTGTIHSEKILKGIVNIAGEYEVPILSDEIYGMITFDGAKAKSIAEVAGDVPTIVCNGMSKFFIGTGWRIGYAAFHDPLDKIAEIKRVTKRYASLYGHTGYKFSSTPVIAAASKVYRGDMKAGQDLLNYIHPERDFAFKRLNEIDGISVVKPRGTFYIFPHVHGAEKIWKTDSDFVLDLLKEEAVFLLPGSPFGESGNFHLRIILSHNHEELSKAFDRLERFMKKHT